MIGVGHGAFQFGSEPSNDESDFSTGVVAEYLEYWYNTLHNYCTHDAIAFSCLYYVYQ